MDLEREIDGRQATRIVQDYFNEQYGIFGVVLFEILNATYDEEKKSWTVDCSFYRTAAASQKDFYSVVLHSDGRIGSVKKIEKEPSR